MESLPTFGAQHPELWARLRDPRWLWHSTSLDALKLILSDGAIHPNAGQLPNTFSQSKVSYARHLGAVSLFDFATEDEEQIFYHEWKWLSVLFRTFRESVVLIRIRSGVVEPTSLLRASDLRAECDPRLGALPYNIRHARMWIPAVEALHIGPIACCAFDGFVLIANGDRDACLWHEATNRTDPVPELLAINAQWKAEREKAIEERFAAGDSLGLSGLIEFVRRRRESGA